MYFEVDLRRARSWPENFGDSECFFACGPFRELHGRRSPPRKKDFRQKTNESKFIQAAELSRVKALVFVNVVAEAAAKK
jgi:hypothetical protein